MQQNDRKKYIRLIFSRTFRYLGIMLVISLLLGTLLGGGVYTMNAVCAIGFVMLGWGWFTYLQMTGMHLPGRNRRQKKAAVPFIHRRFKEHRSHRPSFRMDSSDFDDDLTSATAVDEEAFGERAAAMARVWARIAAGVLLLLVSFFIEY